MIADEPVRGRYGYLEFPGLMSLPGLEQFRPFLKGQVPPAPLYHLSGLTYVETGVGTATTTMPASPWWQSGAGIFTGGVMAFVADAALGGAVYTTLPPKTYVATSQLSMDFLRPAYVESRTLIARSRLIQVGRAQGLSEATIQDAHGRLLAHGTSRCVLVSLPFDPPDPPESFPPLEPETPAVPDPYERPLQAKLVDRRAWETRSGLDLMRDWVAEMLPTPPIAMLLGSRIVEVEAGRVVDAMPASEWFCTAGRAFYGGAVAVFADLAMNGALLSALPANTAYGTLDLRVNFLRRVRPDGRDLVARAEVVHRGQRVAMMTAEVTDADGRRVALASSSAMIIPGRSWAPDQGLAPFEEASAPAQEEGPFDEPPDPATAPRSAESPASPGGNGPA